MQNFDSCKYDNADPEDDDDDDDENYVEADEHEKSATAWIAFILETSFRRDGTTTWTATTLQTT